MSIAALLLADSRFPAGGHAHSGGVEPAVTAGTVTDLASLDGFLRGRLATAGLTAAGLAAAACARVLAGTGADRVEHRTVRHSGRDGGRIGTGATTVGPWAALDAEADARVPSPAQRDASRRQGRSLLRAARLAWPDAEALAELAALAGAAAAPERRGGPHHAVVLGAAAAAAGCSPADAARVAAYQSVAGATSAAVRLLALDPMRANGVLAGLTRDISDIAERAAACADGPLGELPCPSAPALDLLAEAHFTAEVRLFES
jgi:urease accessory protein